MIPYIKDNNGLNMLTYSELEVRLRKLEEKIDLIINKDLMINLYKEHKRLLNSEYSNLLNTLKRELSKYDPIKQVNLKKLILQNLPLKQVHVEDFIKQIRSIIIRHKLNYNIIDLEIFLIKVGAIKNSCVCKDNIPEEELKAYLHVL